MRLEERDSESTHQDRVGQLPVLALIDEGHAGGLVEIQNIDSLERRRSDVGTVRHH
jgi:hypothetical protein